MRLIDADKFKEKLIDYAESLKEMGTDFKLNVFMHRSDAITHAIKLLDNEPTAGGWIFTDNNKHYPNPDDMVVFLTRGNELYFGHYNEDYWIVDAPDLYLEFYRVEVQAWMPLSDFKGRRLTWRTS